MWAMLQAAGAVLAKFGAKHPAVKWGVIALVGLFAVEVVAERGVALMTALQNYKKIEYETVSTHQEMIGNTLSGNMQTGIINTNSSTPRKIEITNIIPPTCQITECTEQWGNYYVALKRAGVDVPEEVTPGTVYHQDTTGKIVAQLPTPR